MAAAAALRVGLAMRGGQLWWPDENRFDTSVVAVRAALQADWRAAFATLFASADHVGFKVLGLIPALGVAAGLPLWTAAAFFGLFSVASIYFVWRIALASSGTEAVANWSAFFAATSTGLFYFSRHLVPYDPALCFGLGCIAVGLRNERAWTAFAAGACAAIGFLIYYGYWLFCGTAFLVAVVAPGGSLRTIGRRAATGLGGFALPILAVLLLGWAAGKDLFHGALAFAQTVNLGDFNEGWTFAWEYLWKTEGWILPVWLLGLAVGGMLARRRRYFLLWVSALVFSYVGLGAMSAIAHQFVLYGRIARCLVPFFCLVGGGGMLELTRFGRTGRLVQWSVAILLGALAANHFAPPLRQWFPDNFINFGKALAATRPPDERIRIVNAYTLNQPVFIDETPSADVLFMRPHPLQFEPLLYENLRPEQRQRYRSHDISMRILRLHPPAPGEVRVAGSGFGDFPGPVRIALRLPRAGDGYSPLLATGTAREGDFLNILRLGRNRFRFNFVHWSTPAVTSVDFTLDEDIDHVVAASLGSMLPAATAAAFREHPEWLQLRRRLFVTIDDQPVFDQKQDFHPASSAEIDFGFNLFGSGTTDISYHGQIINVSPLAPGGVLERIRSDLVKRR